jgi:hypothetical protein
MVGHIAEIIRMKDHWRMSVLFETSAAKLMETLLSWTLSIERIVSQPSR